MQEQYGLAAYRSRTQVLELEERLRRMGVPARTVTTPRAISLGCGLSVRFPLEFVGQVRAAVAAGSRTGLIGLYRAIRDGARLTVTPLR